MSVLVIPKTFAFKEKPIPSTPLNGNFTAIAAVVNDLDEDNVNPASEIALKNAVSAITNVWTFASNPVFNAGGIADAYLTANVPLIDADNVFVGDNTFDEPILGFKLPILGTHPTTAVANNSCYEYSDGNAYIYKHGTGPVRIDYTGGYTGGALRAYEGVRVSDENTPGEIMFKCDVGFSSVKLALIGTEFPSYIYTELPQHLHAVGTLLLTSGTVNDTSHTHITDIGHGHPGTTFASSTHIHTMPNHNHGTGTYAITNVAVHSHPISSDGNDIADASSHDHGGNTDSGGGQTINITGNSKNEDPGDTNACATAASVSSYAGSPTSGVPSYGTPASVGTGITGSTANIGILGNTLNDTKKLNITTAIKLYISNDRGAYGSGYDSGDYAALLDILDDNGTGEIDITARCAVGFNFIKVIDETVKKGGTLMYHLEIV